MELVSASSAVWQWPAVITLSASMSVTEQVERVVPSTETIMPTLRITFARTSVRSVTFAAFSQFGGSAQYQKGSYFGSLYDGSLRNGSELERLVGSCTP